MLTLVFGSTAPQTPLLCVVAFEIRQAICKVDFHRKVIRTGHGKRAGATVFPCGDTLLKIKVSYGLCSVFVVAHYFDFHRPGYGVLVAHRVLPLTGGNQVGCRGGGLGSCRLADASGEGAEVAHGEPIQRGQCEFTIFGFLLYLDLGAQGGKIFVMA